MTNNTMYTLKENFMATSAPHHDCFLTSILYLVYRTGSQEVRVSIISDFAESASPDAKER